MNRMDAISAAGADVSERLGHWNRILFSHIGPIAVSAVNRQEFNATLQRSHCDELEALSIVPTASVSLSRAVASASGVLNLTLQQLGRSWNESQGHSSVLNRGDFMLYDPARPLEQQTGGPYRMIIVHMPAEQAEARVPGITDMVGVPIRGNAGGGAVLSTFLRIAWAQLRATGGRELSQPIADAFWALLPLAYPCGHTKVRPCSASERRWREVQLLIDRGLGSNAFGTRDIADCLGVTSRCVQMLFARHATTPSRYIQRRRLQRAADFLRRQGNQMRITDVALEVGFPDPSSFCRAFRRMYSLSPRQYRTSGAVADPGGQAGAKARRIAHR